ncbi:hypothetical protein SISSUDRAFT_975784, partial [Sistotremastrum suecicum HHB10207 ss-3]
VRAQGIRAKRRRLVAAMRRVDPVGLQLRRRNIIQRQDFRTRRPNSLWSMDGHHKLILWGIVIHGFIDAYCRTV